MTAHFRGSFTRATLIAAAPDMYEALNAISAAHRGSSHAIDGPVWPALELVEAALAKAEGRE